MKNEDQAPTNESSGPDGNDQSNPLGEVKKKLKPIKMSSIAQPIIPLAEFRDKAIPLPGASQEMLDLFERIKRESQD